MKIPLIKPYITQETKDRVCRVLDSGHLTEGSVTREFETCCRDYIGCGHAVAVSNCTVGLEMGLRSLGIGPGDEVIVPDYTYPATASVVQTVGAKIVVVDIRRENMLIDYDAVEAAVTPRTKAIIPVSLFGNPLDYDRLSAIKKKHGLYIIEDAACSLGAAYGKKRVGTFSDLSVFSLHPRKFVTTGEGGLITTHNPEWAQWLVSYKHFGMAQDVSREGVVFSLVGSNHKMSDVLAAIGLVQMEKIDLLLERRRNLAKKYSALLDGYEKVWIPEIMEDARPSYQSYCIFVEDRDALMSVLRNRGIEVQIGTYALHMHPAFNDNPNCTIKGDMQESRYAYDHCLTLPLYHDLTEDDQMRVITELKKARGLD